MSQCCHPKKEKHGHSHSKCCCGSGSFSRRFITKKEQLSSLEDYKKQLEMELEGVKEKIEDLK